MSDCVKGVEVQVDCISCSSLVFHLCGKTEAYRQGKESYLTYTFARTEIYLLTNRSNYQSHSSLGIANGKKYEEPSLVERFQ